LKQTQAGQPERIVRHALWLEYATVGWNVIEAFVAIGAGWLAGSIALVGFGLDSVIEVTTASVLIWRLRCELSCRHNTHERAEQRALQVVGVTFFLLAAYVAYEAGTMLWHREAPQVSVVGLTLAVLSAVIMPFLGLRKRHVARHLGSKALAADAMETLICAYLSVTLLLGLGLNAWLGWWWADPVAALAMLPLILHEGWEALTEGPSK
jgi:divalent metal cation (Fe/Co/Zn/Cd) transporter